VKKNLLKCIAYLFSWVIIAKLIEMIFIDSPSRVAYGLISAWWAALYICRLIDIKINSFALLIFSGIPFLLYLKFASHDNSSLDLYWICASIFLYISPFLLNLVIAFIEKHILLITKKYRIKITGK
jgi:hypothetical protein